MPLLLLKAPPVRGPKGKGKGRASERRESHLADFILKESVVRLFGEFDRIGNGTVAGLEVRDGLPYGVTLEESDPS